MSLASCGLVLGSPGRDRTVDNTTALTTFPSFPRLPQELKLVIWNLAAAVPRIIEVRFSIPPFRKHKFNSRSPVLLQIDHATRDELKKLYSMDLVTKNSLNNVYFNFETDILYLREPLQDSSSPSCALATSLMLYQVKYFVENLPTAVRARIRTLATAGEMATDVRFFSSTFPTEKLVIFSFPALRNLYLLSEYSSKHHCLSENGISIMNCSCASTARLAPESNSHHPPNPVYDPGLPVILYSRALRNHQQFEFPNDTIRHKVQTKVTEAAFQFRRLLKEKRWGDIGDWKEPHICEGGVIHDHMENNESLASRMGRIDLT